VLEHIKVFAIMVSPSGSAEAARRAAAAALRASGT
jgi:hypothetical protein